MSVEAWFARCDEVLERIRGTQLGAIRRAAELIARAAESGGGVHFFYTGHCSGEAIHRAGGLCLLRPLKFSFAVETHAAPQRAQETAVRREGSRDRLDEKLAALAVERSDLAPGDVLIISSVSGKSASVVELALAAQRMGAKVVAITSVTYSSAVESRHSSGKRLFEVSEVVVDNCGEVGDAVLNVEGLDAPMAPTSGVAFCYIIWAVMAEAVARMLARGIQPHLYRSVNLPGGEEFNAHAEAAYRETGI